jgi:hypothetical protein
MLLSSTLRFADRDMMMCFLGWGIRHLNLPDFPHEANEFIASDEDKVLIQYGNVTAETGHTEGLEVGLEDTGEGSDDNISSVDDDDAEIEIEFEY